MFDLGRRPGPLSGGRGAAVLEGEGGAAIPGALRLAILWADEDAQPPIAASEIAGDSGSGHDRVSLGPAPARMTVVLPADPTTYRFPNIDCAAQVRRRQVCYACGMEPSTRTGSCLCGAITFEIELPSKWCAHCHCSMCRRAHGAAFVTWFGVEVAQFRLTAGAGELTRHASSPGTMRSFCGRCGSSLFFESARWPGEVHIALANLHGELDRAPQAHVFWETHVPWVVLGDALPRKTSQAAG